MVRGQKKLPRDTWHGILEENKAAVGGLWSACGACRTRVDAISFPCVPFQHLLAMLAYLESCLEKNAQYNSQYDQI